MFFELVNKNGNKFYPVKNNLVDIQDELGVILPKDLKSFYEEVGYGFLKSENYRFNRILSPNSLKDFRLRKGEFEDIDDLEVYKEYEKDRLIFFEVSEGFYLSIGFAGDCKGKIYNYDKIIADSLNDFLIKYQDNETYFS